MLVPRQIWTVPSDLLSAAEAAAPAKLVIVALGVNFAVNLAVNLAVNIAEQNARTKLDAGKICAGNFKSAASREVNLDYGLGLFEIVSCCSNEYFLSH